MKCNKKEESAMMKKRILAVITALAVLCSTAAPVMGAEAAEKAAETTGTTYYVSSLHGKDTNDGMSQSTPFYSLQKINSLELKPGDQILLESGSVFKNGYLHLYEQSGSKEAPIVVDKYGEGAAPVIDTNGQGVWFQNYGKSLDNNWHKYRGYVSSSILLYDTEYIEIRNLEIVNRNPKIDTIYNATDMMDRTGVAAVAQDKGTIEHIHLENLNIHDVIGNVYDKHMNNGGIYFTVYEPHNEAATGISRYDDVLIDGCTVKNVNRWGIAVGYTTKWDRFQGSAISDETIRQYGSTNVVIQNNYVKDAGGDSITLMYCDRPLVQYNVSDGAARQMHSGDYGPCGETQRFAAGIWPWKCKDAVFQYNEAFDTKNVNNENGDGQAWDADWADGTVYQYNYSHNNEGGCFMVCLSEAYRTTFRYNISQEDLRSVLDTFGNPTVHVYNNVFYVKEGVPLLRDRSGGAMIAENNIFYYSGSEAREENWNVGGTNKTYSNNLYYNYSNAPASDTAAVSVPAGTQVFRQAGTAPASPVGVARLHEDPAVRSAFEGYKLAENSPAIGAGKVITDSNGKELCEKDFFGNAISATETPDIGAHKYQANETATTPAAPQKVEVSEAGETSVTLSWPAAWDIVGIEKYQIMDGDTVLKEVAVSDENAQIMTATLENLQPGKSYSISVVAYDKNGVASKPYSISFVTAAQDVSGVKESLSGQIAQAKALKSTEYTPESWNVFQTALKRAESVLASSGSTKEELDTALANLQKAIAGLQKKQQTATSLKLDKTSATIYTKGKKTVTLKASGVTGAVTWTSSNPKAATVKDGKVTAKKAGKTVVTASAGGYKASCTITVKKPTLKIRSKKAVVLRKGKKSKIKVKAVPTGKITYKSSNKKVASVTKKGVIKGVKAGRCKITVQCNGVKKTVKVRVK